MIKVIKILIFGTQIMMVTVKISFIMSSKKFLKVILPSYSHYQHYHHHHRNWHVLVVAHHREYENRIWLDNLAELAVMYDNTLSNKNDALELPIRFLTMTEITTATTMTLTISQQKLNVKVSNINVIWWERKWWEQPTTTTSSKQMCMCLSRDCCIRRTSRALRAFHWALSHRYLVSLIVNKTNWYADQYLLANAEKKVNSYLHEREDTNVPEINTFLHVLLLMGVT